MVKKKFDLPLWNLFLGLTIAIQMDAITVLRNAFCLSARDLLALAGTNVKKLLVSLLNLVFCIVISHAKIGVLPEFDERFFNSLLSDGGD